MSQRAENNNPTKAIRGKRLVTEVLNDASTQGVKLTTTDNEVPHGTEPEGPTFGVLRDRIYNERNSNKSRREIQSFSVYEPLESAKITGMEQLGGDEVVTEEDWVDLSEDKAEDLLTPMDLTLIQDSIEKIDQVHGRRTRQRVKEWNPRTTTTYDNADVFGAKTEAVMQVLPLGEPEPTGDDLIEVIDEQLDAAKMLRTIVRASDLGGDPSQPIGSFTSWEEEPVTGLRVQVLREAFVQDPGMLVDTPARSVVSVVQNSNNLWTRITKTIDASILTETFLEYHNVDYYFNSYLDPLIPFNVITDQTTVSPNKSGDQQLKVPARYEVTYHTTAQGPDTIFQFKTVDLSYIDGQFRIDVPNIICDDGEIVLRKLIQLTYSGTSWGGFNVNEIPLSTFSWKGSSPTATEYIDMMGEEKLIADDTVRWKYDLWRRTKIFITLPDLTEEFGDLTYEAYGPA